MAEAQGVDPRLLIPMRVSWLSDYFGEPPSVLHELADKGHLTSKWRGNLRYLKGIEYVRYVEGLPDQKPGKEKGPVGQHEGGAKGKRGGHPKPNAKRQVPVPGSVERGTRVRRLRRNEDSSAAPVPGGAEEGEGGATQG